MIPRNFIIIIIIYSSPADSLFSSQLAPGELVNDFAGLTQSFSAQTLLRQSQIWSFKLQLEDLFYLKV